MVLTCIAHSFFFDSFPLLLVSDDCPKFRCTGVIVAPYAGCTRFERASSKGLSCPKVHEHVKILNLIAAMSSFACSKTNSKNGES